MSSRKGALELSVTGVVVLIIAIVVLGSVIFFIRSFFGETQGLIGQQLASVKEQLRKTIDETGEPIAMDFGRELNLKRGSPQEIYLGMRNDFVNQNGDAVCYFIQFLCLRSFSSANPGQGNNCAIDTDISAGDALDPRPTLVGGYDLGLLLNGEPIVQEATRPWTTKMLDRWDIPERGTDVNPITFQVSGVDPDTYQMELRVYYMPSYGDCSQAVQELNSGAAIPALWQTKRFLVELS